MENVIKIVWHDIKHGIELTKDFGDLPSISCHPQQLSQVFLNIIVNASQAISGKGHIGIKTRAENGFIVVDISDDGAGMEKDVAERIFDPFFTTKPIGKGTGLGLSIAYGIVREHGGYIDVKSEPGKGSTFTVLLPIDRDAQP